MQEQSITQDNVQDPISILLVEDDIPTQDFMSMALGKGFVIHNAVSAHEARLVLDEVKVDLILMDLSIKGDEDGIHLTKQLRASEKWKNIPIIALTAHAYDRDRINALSAGCNAYFSKPFFRKELIQKIDELMKSNS